ncbi:hypothetical protein ASE59_11705 [Sphingomonas sp. Leaf10]|nr:hypothetical protein ASE59_11705 [Sphingomonas sp. Leaf10]
MQRRQSFSGRPAIITVNDRAVPTDIDAYCAWLNGLPQWVGEWSVIRMADGTRAVHRGHKVTL